MDSLNLVEAVAMTSHRRADTSLVGTRGPQAALVLEPLLGFRGVHAVS